MYRKKIGGLFKSLFVVLVSAAVGFASAQEKPTPVKVSGLPGVANKTSVIEVSSLPPSGLGDFVFKASPFSPISSMSFAEEHIEEAPEPGITTLTGPGPQSPLPSFFAQGVVDNFTRIPPDTMGAVGPNHLMITLNSEVAIQSRTGSLISSVSLPTFWQSLGHSDVFDPKVLYDPYAQRWLFTAMADRRSATSAVLIGVSRSNDPTGQWNLYSIDADSNNQNWADFPSIGFNRNWIVVSANMFPNGGGSAVGVKIYAFNKADLYAGGVGRHTVFSRNDIGFTHVPAITYDPNLTTMYLLNTWSSSQLRRYTITGDVGAEVLTLGGFPTSPQAWSSAPVGDLNIAPQLGSARRIHNGDARMANLVYRNGSLWAAHTVFLPAGAPTRTAVQWWEMFANAGVKQLGRIDDPSGVNFYAYPSISANQYNDVLIGFSQFSPFIYASAAYAFRAETDPLNNMRAPRMFKAGEAPYYKVDDIGRNRWGDYSATMPDPLDDYKLYTLQEYAASPSGGRDRWATWWSAVTPPTYTLAVQPNAIAILRGVNNLATVQSQAVGDFFGPVRFDWSGPVGLSANFDPPVVIGSGSSTITVSASRTIPVGNYQLTISGSAGSRSASTTLTVVVADYVVSAAQPTQTVAAGRSITYSIDVVALNGFQGAVDLTIGNLPAGMTAQFSPSRITNQGRSTLTITTASTLPADSYPLTVRATSSGQERTTEITLLVTSSVSLAVPAGSKVFAGPGEVINIPLRVRGEGIIRVSVENLPPDASALIDPMLLDGMPENQSNLDIRIGDSTPAGSYTVTIRASNGSQSAVVRFTFQVIGQSLIAQPSIVSIQPGEVASYTVQARGFSGEVSLWTSGIETIPDAVAWFNPPTLQGGGTTSLNIYIPPNHGSNVSLIRAHAASTTEYLEELVGLSVGDFVVQPLVPYRLQATPGRSITTFILVSQKFADVPFSWPVNLSVGNLPNGVTVEFDPPTVYDFPTNVRMVIRTHANTPVNGYSLRVYGTTDAGLRRETIIPFLVRNDLTINVLEEPLPSAEILVGRGGAFEYRLQIEVPLGFTEPVTMSTEYLPAGVEARFDPTIITGGGEVRMVLTVPSRAGASGDVFSIRARSSSQSDNIMRQLAHVNFSVSHSPEPNRRIITPGMNAVWQVWPKWEFGYLPGEINFSIGTLPPGTSASFGSLDPGSGRRELRLTSSASTPPGTYTIPVTLTHIPTGAQRTSGLPLIVVP